MKRLCDECGNSIPDNKIMWEFSISNLLQSRRYDEAPSKGALL